MLINRLDRNKEIVPYVFWGICTTLVNICVYWLSVHLFNFGVVPATILAWIIAVLFAYVTNRKWVFHSSTSQAKTIIMELLSFIICRLGTGIVDWICMYVFVFLLSWNDIIIKSAANVLVIILNYLASKYLIFMKRGDVG